MITLLRHSLKNLLRASIGNSREVDALVPLYHITPFCNLRCTYCDGLLEKRGRSNAELSADGVKRVLEIVREEFEYIFLTGGEPFMRQDIVEILKHAHYLRFKKIAINSNSLFIRDHEEALNYIHELSISLDMLNTNEYDKILGVDGSAEKIIENVERYGVLGKRFGFTLTVHCIIMPGRIAHAREVLRFCLDRGIKICLSPMVIDYCEDAWFHNNNEYSDFIDEIAGLKKSTGLISGSMLFIGSIRDFPKYDCYPFLIPRIFPMGELLYPCRPLGEFRKRINLIDAGSWKKAVKNAKSEYGPAPQCGKSCRIRCYIEPSMMLTHPLSVISEFFL